MNTRFEAISKVETQNINLDRARAVLQMAIEEVESCTDNQYMRTKLLTHLLHASDDVLHEVSIGLTTATNELLTSHRADEKR